MDNPRNPPFRPTRADLPSWLVPAPAGLRTWIVDALLTALAIAALALCSNDALKPWQVPKQWGECLEITPFAATSLSIGLLITVIGRLSLRQPRRAAPVIATVLMMPLLFNGLLLLAAPALLRSLGDVLNITDWPWPNWQLIPAGALSWIASIADQVGLTALASRTDAFFIATLRGLCLALISETLLIGLGWLIDRRRPRGLRIHGLIALACAWAAFAPLMADWASLAQWHDAPLLVRSAITMLGAASAEAGLWALTFLLTGILLDSLRGQRPTLRSSLTHWHGGLGKGAVYGAVFMALIQLGAAASAAPALQIILHPLVPQSLSAGMLPALLVCALLGAACFPLARTLVESFDGSAPFLQRLRHAYLTPMNALRGLLLGIGLGLAFANHWPALSDGLRFLYCAALGIVVSAGADALRDGWAIRRGQRQRLQHWRIYAFSAILGGVVAGALGWYFDASQLQVVLDKFQRYAQLNFQSSGSNGFDATVYPLFSKWGAIPLGHVDGGVALLYSESLAGVINWAIAAPLFSLNLVALTALFQRSLHPLRNLLSVAGLVSVIEQTVRVLRWGPWMAPIISSFLRMAPQPSWYNQDGAIRTIAAVYQSLWLSPEDFRAWGRDVFKGLLAYDWLRILIWFDHMGLRVATLVNLSFVGADRLDEKSARWLGHSGRTRVIPEGVRRFLTWAPLLIPFYIPRGADWDYAWGGAEQLGHHPEAPLLPAVVTLGHIYLTIGTLLLVLLLVIGNEVGQLLRNRRGWPAQAPLLELTNGAYSLRLAADGRGYAQMNSAVRDQFIIDLTRKPDDPQQQRGKFFIIREVDENGRACGAAWSLAPEPIHNPAAHHDFQRSAADQLTFSAHHDGIDVRADVSVDADQPQEYWRLKFRNCEDRTRYLEITSYQEFAVGPTDQYRRTPFFAAMHVGTTFIGALQAIFARNRLLKSGANATTPISQELAFHAVAPDPAINLIGYQDSRTRFIGLGTLAQPAALTDPPAGTLRPIEDEGLLYSLDPAAALRVQLRLPPFAITTARFMDGYATDELSASQRIAEHFGISEPSVAKLDAVLHRDRELHTQSFDELQMTESEVFSGTPDAEQVQAPSTALRPWTHVLANELGHAVILSGDGDRYSLVGNAQQNGISSYTLDSLPSQTPSSLIYLKNTHTGEIDTTGFVPMRRTDAQRKVEFGLGFARFTQQRRDLLAEQTIFVPPDQPLEIHLLRLQNLGTLPMRLRVVPFVDLMLAEAAIDSLEDLNFSSNLGLGAVFFERRRNDFRHGCAFVASSLEISQVETVRTRFFGLGGNTQAPAFVLNGTGDRRMGDDGRRVAALSGELALAPGQTQFISVLIGQVGQSDDANGAYTRACELIQQWRQVEKAQQALIATQQWWFNQLGDLHIRTTRPDFDRLVNQWLPYQLLTARLWARSGPQQRSGAFGFRDQLQDVLPLAALEPARARQQILLHAAQQFREGDAPKWWHPSWEGKTGICVRTAASDPHLWLPYVTAAYLRSSGDAAILDEVLPFMEAPPLPKGQEGTMFVPRASRDQGTLYEHCRRAIEWSLARFGAHDLPLIGSGDWNDGIDLPGLQGRGESVWLGFFLHSILLQFIPLAQARAPADAQRYRTRAAQLQGALDACWRSDTGYLRAYTDAGEAFVTCDALMSAWPALSGAVPPARALAAIEHGLSQLEKDDRVLLLTPPFNEHSAPYPGRIAEYPPGIRENGGQYSHGASWLVDALLTTAQQTENPDQAAALRARAWTVWQKISPLSKTEPESLLRFGLPPHQQAADAYDGAGHDGVGGWAWYTGAAARMLSAAHQLIGLEWANGELKLAEHTFAEKGDLRLLEVRWKRQKIVASE